MITQQIGNYFIMDSETLVSKPLQEMQTEVLGEINKKNSNTERFTIVKNNVCENHFNLAKVQLQQERDFRLKNIHENASRLRFEVKLLDLDRRRNNIEFRKRIEPKRDYSYDDNQICKSQKRLGANIESYYLDRKLRYPVRQKTVSDMIVTPTVAKARNTLQKAKQRPESERIPTAKSLSSSITGLSSRGQQSGSRRKWPTSRSAPLTASSYSAQSRLKESESRFPNISQRITPSYAERDKQRGPLHHVKFAFESPHKLIVSKETRAALRPPDPEDTSNHMFRSFTYYEGMGRHPTFQDDSSLDYDDSDDDFYPSERIDLRAILFGKSRDEDATSTKSHPVSQSGVTFTTQNPGTNIRRSQAPQQHTQEKIRKEAKVIQTKIDTFLHRLETDPPIRKKFDYESESEEEMIETEDNTIPIFLRKKKLPPPLPPKPEPPKVEPKPESSDDQDEEEDTKTVESQEKRDPKEAWKYIKGHTENGSLRGTYTAADLVLQQLTGVLIGRRKKTSYPTIPLHAASRAMRHTATFKMRKVVEDLIESRTRYEQHKVDELKKKMDGEGDEQNANNVNTSPPSEIPQEVV